MNINTSDRFTRGHRVGRLSALIVVGVVAVGLAGCQTPAVWDNPAAPPVRQAEARPAGVAPHATADQIERALSLRESTIAARYAGVPADRVAEQLDRERDASRGFLSGCVSYRVVEHPGGGWHVICVELRR
ncbi:hypothetical protein [Microbacterium sp. CFBP9034]|uniref:hypothetical protein n=1 Tax=Microbacterium sp. CFBP9034 TaxID=3096540 RepID=UPI002A69BA86|nr:hypothetical protein [Microbacterium sp. CFBP9034]MDY0909422.1 hypothetical protein [Microbacterium sp. CFBP9034]